VRNVPSWRLLLSRTLSAWYRFLVPAPLHTWTACFRVYRRAAVAELPLVHPGFLGTAELLVRVLRRGGTVLEHPCVLEARLFGFSKMKVLRTIRQHLGLLWQVARGRIR
jgi:dolichol-phosphate mannosyltransferase